MKIEKNKVVEVIYTLEVEGEVKEEVKADKPMDFIFGTSSILPSFEKELDGLAVGDKFTFDIQPKDGQGEYSTENIIDFPMEAFMVDGKVDQTKLIVGSTINLMNNAGGIVPGLIVAVTESTVTIDANPPLAGKVLNFKGEILTIREATEEELRDGLHGEFIRSHGGCGCGCGCGHEEEGCGDGDSCGCGHPHDH